MWYPRPNLADRQTRQAVSYYALLPQQHASINPPAIYAPRSTPSPCMRNLRSRVLALRQLPPTVLQALQDPPALIRQLGLPQRRHGPGEEARMPLHPRLLSLLGFLPLPFLYLLL